MEKLTAKEIESVSGSGFILGSILNRIFRPTTLAIGENGESTTATTLAFGEEDGGIKRTPDAPKASTLAAFGEEDGGILSIFQKSPFGQF